LNWTLAPGHTLGWQTLLTATAFRANRATASEVLQGPPYPYADFHYRRRDHAASLRSDASWSFKWASGLRLDSTAILELSDERRGRRSDAADAAGMPTLTRIYTTTPDSRRASWNGKFTYPVVEGHTVTAGWDASFTRQRDHETQREQPEEDFDRKLRADVARLAAYAQDEWEISKQLSLYAGLRHEASRTATSGSDFATHAVRSNVASPLLQALYKLPGDGKHQLRAALTRTFRAPDTGQLLPRRFRSIANSEVSPDSGGNPELRPEIARGVDIAYEHYWAEGAMWSVSAAERSIDDAIIYSVREEGKRWISAPRNHGQARMRSLEMEAKLPLGATKFAFSLGRHWSEVDSVPGPDNRLASQTPWTGNASVDYRAGAWGAGGSAGFNGGAWSRQSESQSGYKARTRALEAFLTYRPDAASLWRLTAIHALDHRLATASRYVSAQWISENISYRRPERALRIVYERKL
jgi:outer membrane receptor protein involved in Fe transport